MGFRVKFDVIPELVKPKLDGLDVTTITLSDLLPTSTASTTAGVSANRQNTTISDQQASNQGSYDWQSWTFSLSLSNMQGAVKVIEGFLKTLDKLTQVITLILKIIRLLSGNVKSIAMFLKFLIKKVAEELKTFLNSFTSTGIYFSLIMPNFDKKFPKYTIPVYGGYKEFIARVNATCTSSQDPDAPKFDSPEDKVGGFVLAMLGGVNDPSFLADLFNNFRVLSEFFGFQNPTPTPPKNFRAKAGLYRERGSSTSKMGVKLFWERPDTPVSSYVVYRSTSLKPIYKSENPKQDGVEIKVRVLGKIITTIENQAILLNYSYTDFDVTEGNTYYYKVYSIVGDNFFETYPELEDIKSPVATPIATAKPINKIPLSELKKYTVLSTNGELMSPFDFEGDWQSITVRRMLGKSLDSVFTQIDALADKLTGLVDTGSNATNQYLKFYAKRVSTLLEAVTQFSDIIQRLLAFNLRGTFMLLRLPIESGGMENFVRRFNRASSLGDSENGVSQNTTGVATVTTNGGISQYRERGIMLGIIVLYGFPTVTTDRLLQVVPPNQVADLKKRLETSEKAISTLLKLLGLE